MGSAFVVGATGFTGREVVRALRERGATTFAHVRPDSPRLEEWQPRFGELGATVDVTAWDEGALTRRMAEIEVDLVFALLGTTRARASAEGRRAAEAYERIDYGLTALVLRASVACGRRPRFVYLSSAGAGAGAGATRGAYLEARRRVEADVRAASLPFTIARPSIITGPGRDDPRPAEELGARLLDAALAVVGSVGARRIAARYRSTTNQILARALVGHALDPASEADVVESEDLRG